MTIKAMKCYDANRGNQHNNNKIKMSVQIDNDD